MNGRVGGMECAAMDEGFIRESHEACAYKAKDRNITDREIDLEIIKIDQSLHRSLLIANRGVLICVIIILVVAGLVWADMSGSTLSPPLEIVLNNALDSWLFIIAGLVAVAMIIRGAAMYMSIKEDLRLKCELESSGEDLRMLNQFVSKPR
jgi:hypothetical protein